MYKMVVSLVITLGVTSGAWAARPAERRLVYTVYPVRSCVSSAGHFVCDTAKGVAQGAVTVLEGTWGIVTAPFRVEWKKPSRRYFFYQPPEVTYKPGKMYEVIPTDIEIEPIIVEPVE